LTPPIGRLESYIEWQLIQTVPARIWEASRCAEERFVVQMLAASPYTVSLAIAGTSSIDRMGDATTTGPKISSRTTFMAGFTSTSTVGSMKVPAPPT